MSLKEIMKEQIEEERIWDMIKEWCSDFFDVNQTSHLVSHLTKIYGKCYDPILKHMCTCVHSRLKTLPNENDQKLLEKFEHKWKSTPCELADEESDEDDGEEEISEEEESDDDDMISSMVSMYKNRI